MVKMPTLPKRDVAWYKNQNKPPERPRNRKRDPFYHTNKWKKFSESYRSEHPFCAQCKKENIITQSTVTDHIIQKNKYNGSPYDKSNLQPLCDRCHNVKRQKESRI